MKDQEGKPFFSKEDLRKKNKFNCKRELSCSLQGVEQNMPPGLYPVDANNIPLNNCDSQKSL